jgi:hypothetical protein
MITKHNPTPHPTHGKLYRYRQLDYYIGFIIYYKSDTMSDNPFIRAARAGKRLDYHQLNDGSDEEADLADRIEPLPKRPHLASSSSNLAVTIE